MKFIVIADTHWGGANLCGFQMQPRYPERLDDLLAALDNLICREKADFVIHAGDMTENGAAEEIQSIAGRLARFLSVPVMPVLGNHDSLRPDCEALWLQKAPALFPEGVLDRTFLLDGVRLDLLSLFWGRTARHWIPDQGQFIRLSQQQLDRLRSGNQSVPRIIVMHSQIRAAEPMKTGLESPLLEPENGFDLTGDALIREFHPMLIVGGHNHLNLLDSIDGTLAVTASSFCESPFECRIAEFTSGILSIRTVALGGEMPFDYLYREKDAYVQGTPADRTASVRIRHR